MAKRPDRLTVSQFTREVLDQRTPLFYAIAVCLGTFDASTTYQDTANVPAALVLGTALGAAIFVLMCAVTWFLLRIRGV